MRSFRRRLPSLNALVTFEAAARALSFSIAAQELGVSQAAVSRQIKALEEELGIKLFRRGNRTVELTVEALLLSQSLHQALELVSDAVDNLRKATRPKVIRVGTTVAFSHFWLLPRLKRLREEKPSLNIRVVSRDEPFDLRRDEVDIIMRFGNPPFDDGTVITAIEDKVFPVCSPAFAAQAGGPVDLRTLQGMTLIGTDSQHHSWMNWAIWLAQAGAHDGYTGGSLQFNHYTDGIAAAMAGQGVALGWDFVVRDLLATGQLVRLTDISIPSTATYNMVVSKAGLKSQLLVDAADWFCRMFEEHRSTAIPRP